MRLGLIFAFLLGSVACGGNAASGGGNGARCDTNADCGGETPTCRGDGFCVECTGNQDCTGGDAVCGAGLCGECVADNDCAASQPFCDTSRAECTESHAERRVQIEFPRAAATH